MKQNNGHKSDRNKLFKTKLEKLEESTQRYNLVFGWVKNNKITYKQFQKCIEKIKFLEERSIARDTFE